MSKIPRQRDSHRSAAVRSEKSSTRKANLILPAVAEAMIWQQLPPTARRQSGILLSYLYSTSLGGRLTLDASSYIYLTLQQSRTLPFFS